MSDSSVCPAVLLGRARAGESEALGGLLEMYRNYLRLLARTQMPSDLRVRLDPSDLVQETLAAAYRDFAQFAGATERQLMSWLRSILAHSLANQVKHHHTRKRNLHQDRSLEHELDRSSMKIEQALVAKISTPSGQAVRRERSVILADALARLPAHYREVIIMRQLEGARFSDVAARLGRSPGAVRMVWVRALERLRIELEDMS